MYESNVLGQYVLPTGENITETRFQFPTIPDSAVLTKSVAAVGFDCGALRAPTVNLLTLGAHAQRGLR